MNSIIISLNHQLIFSDFLLLYSIQTIYMLIHFNSHLISILIILFNLNSNFLYPYNFTLLNLTQSNNHHLFILIKYLINFIINLNFYFLVLNLSHDSIIFNFHLKFISEVYWIVSIHFLIILIIFNFNYSHSVIMLIFLFFK